MESNKVNREDQAIPASGLKKWRARKDLNLRPSPPERETTIL